MRLIWQSKTDFEDRDSGTPFPPLDFCKVFEKRCLSLDFGSGVLRLNAKVPVVAGTFGLRLFYFYFTKRPETDGHIS
jgi:hypothetical protein